MVNSGKNAILSTDLDSFCLNLGCKTISKTATKTVSLATTLRTQRVPTFLAHHNYHTYTRTNIMVLKLFMVWGSPPVNAVLMTAKALNLKLELREIDFAQQEYLEEWYLKINPSHTVPCLDDDGFVLWDSHAILVYLLVKYGQNSCLLWKSPEEKYRTLQILNLDCGTIFRRLSDCLKPLFYENATSINPKHLVSLKELYETLDRILSSSQFLAGDKLSIADLSAFSSIIVANLFLPVEDSCPKLKLWIRTLRGQEWFEAATRGFEAIQLGLKAKLGPNILQHI